MTSTLAFWTTYFCVHACRCLKYKMFSRHDIVEILLKLALNTNQIKYSIKLKLNILWFPWSTYTYTKKHVSGLWKCYSKIILRTELTFLSYDCKERTCQFLKTIRQQNIIWQKFEDTKGMIKSHNAKKDIQYKRQSKKGQKDKQWLTIYHQAEN